MLLELEIFRKFVLNFHYYSYLPSASTTNVLYNLSHERDTAELSPLMDMHGDICARANCIFSSKSTREKVLPGICRKYWFFLFFCATTRYV